MLAQLQRAAVELCYGPEPSAEQLAALGDARIWGIYREAVRKRLRGELEVALPRTRAALGDEAFGALFERFLRDAPPTTRFFHAVVAAFAQAARPWLREAGHVAHAADLCAYEAARWTVADASDDVQGELTEFAFDRAAVLSPAVQLLQLEHAVYLAAEADGAYAKGAVQLCVYRKREERAARYFVLNPITAALMQRFARGGESVAQSVHGVAAERGISVDQPFLDGLCTVLADFIEQGVILGGRG